MALNLNSIFAPDSRTFNNEDLVTLELDLLTLENDINNCCNALEIAEKAQDTQSSEVMRFAEDLLGCGLEELVKGLGYEKDSTKKDILTSVSQKLAMAKNAFQQLYNEFGSLGRKAKSQTIVLKVPNLGSAASKGLASANAGFNVGDSKEMPVKEACRRLQNACKSAISIIDKFDASQAEKIISRQKHHDNWRKYQYLVSFGRRALSELRKMLAQIKSTIGKN